MKLTKPHNELIELCLKNNKNAQFKVYKLYYKAMYNTAYRIVGDSLEAEDVMQEAFLNAFTKIHQYKKEVTFGAWLKKIVINKSISALQKNKRIDIVPLEKVTIKENNEPESTNYTITEPKIILEKIALLKTNYKIAITLNLIEGYDYKEIAQIMNISYENSRTTISRAKNKLRKLLVYNYAR